MWNVDYYPFEVVPGELSKSFHGRSYYTACNKKAIPILSRLILSREGLVIVRACFIMIDALVEEGSRESELPGNAGTGNLLADGFGERPRLYSLYKL